MTPIGNSPARVRNSERQRSNASEIGVSHAPRIFSLSAATCQDRNC